MKPGQNHKKCLPFSLCILGFEVSLQDLEAASVLAEAGPLFVPPPVPVPPDAEAALKWCSAGPVPFPASSALLLVVLEKKSNTVLQ